MSKFLQRVLLLLLLLLPIVDYLYKWEQSSPAVMIRAGVTAMMGLFLLPQIIRHFNQRKSPMIPLVMLLSIYILIVTVLIDGGFKSFYIYVRVIYPLIGLLLIYYWTKYEYLDEKFFVVVLFLLIVIYGVISYLNLGYRLVSRRGLSVADNTGYSLVTLLAGVLFFTKKKYIFPITIFIIISGALFCGKRGAIVVLFVALLPLVKYILTSYSRNVIRKMAFIVFAILASLIAVYFFGDYFSAAMARFQKLEEDGGSGRNTMYMLYLTRFWESDFIHELFGHGLYAGVWGNGRKYAFIGLLAHNDWLEMLYDFGIVGCFLYILIFISVFVKIWNNRKNKDNIYYMLLMSVIIWGLKSMLSSTFLMTPNSIYMLMILAYAMAKMEINNKPKNSLNINTRIMSTKTP